MQVTFWGTRGSIPTPLKPREVEEKICRAILRLPSTIDIHNIDAVRAYVRDLPPLQRGTAGGNSPCIEVQTEDQLIIIDSGSGIRDLGQRLMHGPCGKGEGTVHILISHLHWDHIQGFPMFAPAFVRGNRIIICGAHADIKKAFELQQNPVNWPVSLSYMKASIEFVRLEVGTPFVIGQTRVHVIKNTHPGDSYSYRVEDQHSVLVYASDAEYKELDDTSVQPHIDFFRNADALIFDTQYTLRQAWQRVDWGHSSAMIGVDFARVSNVKRLILFHHDPASSDEALEEIQQTAMAYLNHDTSHPTIQVTIAYEGLEIDLTPPGAIDMQVTEEGDAAILTPAQVFDEFAVEEIVRKLQEGSEERVQSILDLSKVENLTTASLKALVALRQTHSGAPIVIAAPSESVQQVTNLSGYRDGFAIYPSVDDALAAIRAREAAQLPGQLLLRRYQIEKQVGESQISTVLQATDTRTNRPVALKILSPAFSKETLNHFIAQAHAIIALDHPNIVKAFAWEQEEGRTFKVEEYMTGPTLEEHLETLGGTLPAEQAMDIALDITYALEYAHRRGVIHGDLKPSNIFLTATGARVNEFGLGRLSEGHNLLDMPLLYLNAPYLAPEQILGQPLDARTDLYALGVILYQLFTGCLPFAGSDEEVLQAHLRKAPRPPRELAPHLSLSLEHLIRKLLAKNPNDRYASAQQARRISSSLLIHNEEPHQHAPLLVGRAAQVQALRECWTDTQTRNGQLVFITGEIGVGKTSLAQQVTSQCQPPVLLSAQSREMTGTPAYQLFSEILRLYFNTVPPEFAQDASRQLIGNFIHLIPQGHKMLPDISPPSPLEPEQEQLRLMSSITQFIKQATRERPWMVILDDLQWADDNSLELLHHLGRHLPGMALMLVGIYREDDLGPDHPLRETLRDLSAHPGYLHIPLTRLDEEGVAHILTQFLQQPPPATLSRCIYEQTDGNPFYVEEVIQALIEEGQIRLQGGQWYFPDITEIRLPPSVREAVWARIGQLSPDTQALLRQAAVLGQTFKFADLREMSGLSEWQLLEHLDLAMARQLIQEMPGDMALRFRHTEIRHVLYSDLGPLRRRMLHRQAGLALEKRAATPFENNAAELAYHFGEAGELEKALHHSMAAASQAQHAYANTSALMWYQRALGYLHALDADIKPRMRQQHLAAHQALGQVMTLMGQYDDALQHYAQARDLLGTRIAPGTSSRQYAHLCAQTAHIHEKRGEYAEALDWLQRGIRHLDTEQPTLEQARIYIATGRVRLSLGEGDAAKAALGQARALARSAQNRASSREAIPLAEVRRVEADSLRALGDVARYYLSHAEARAYYEQAFQLFQEIGERQGAGGVLKALGNLCLDLGDDKSAHAHYRQALEHSRAIGNWPEEGLILNNLGVVARRQGDHQQALECYEQALHILCEVGNRQGESLALGNLGFALYCQGKYAEARAFYAEALQINRANGYRRAETSVLINLTTLHNSLGQYQLAHEYGQQALDLATAIESCHKQSSAHIGIGHALTAMERYPAARTAYEAALALWPAEQQGDGAVEAWAGLARLALAQGHSADALAYVERILAYLESGGSLTHTEDPFQVYLTCYHILQAHQDDRATAMLRTAYATLQTVATHIDNDSTRRTFLENVPTHREIVNQYAAPSDTTETTETTET